MKNLPKQRITGTPIIFMQGGVVQDVFLPKRRGKQSFTTIDYDLVDMDIFEGNDDETIGNHWERLEPETKKYFIEHRPHTYRPFKEALDRRDAERARLTKRFTMNRKVRAIEDIKFGEWVLRRNLDDGTIDTIRLYTALAEFRPSLDKKLFPTEYCIVKRLAEGAVFSAGKFEYVLDEQKD